MKPTNDQWVAVVTGPHAGHSGKLMLFSESGRAIVHGRKGPRVVNLEDLVDKDGRGFSCG